MIIPNTDLNPFSSIFQVKQQPPALIQFLLEFAKMGSKGAPANFFKRLKEK